MCFIQVKKYGEEHDWDIFWKCIGVTVVWKWYVLEESLQFKEIRHKSEATESRIQNEGIDEEELSNNQFFLR